MKSKLVATVLLCLIACATIGLVGCSFGHSRNDMSIEVTEIQPWFENTGIMVKNLSTQRAYLIVKDKHGWLYYASSVDECIEPVRDAEGNMTKDISIFNEENSTEEN